MLRFCYLMYKWLSYTYNPISRNFYNDLIVLVKDKIQFNTYRILFGFNVSHICIIYHWIYNKLSIVVKLKIFDEIFIKKINNKIYN